MDDPHGAIDTLAQIDVAQVDEGGIKRHVATNIARNTQLHLRVERLVECHGQCGTMLPEEGARIESGHDVGGFVGLEIVLRHGGGCAATTGPHSDDVQIFLVEIAEGEPVFRLGTPRHRAEIMAGDRKHLVRPFLGVGGGRQACRQGDKRQSPPTNQPADGIHGKHTKKDAAGEMTA